MEIVVGNSSALPGQVLDALAAYRWQVFVERLAWDLRCDGAREFDSFDRPDTVHVVALDDRGRVVGCSRLLPTTRPYLLSQVFPELLHGRAAPCSGTVWELSRFAAVDPDDESGAPFGTSSSPTAAALIHASIDGVRLRGACELITVGPPDVEDRLRSAGFGATRWGPALEVRGHWLGACSITVGPRGAATGL